MSAISPLRPTFNMALQRTRRSRFRSGRSLGSPLNARPFGITWTSTGMTTFPGRVLPWLLLLYCGASLLHFVHNAAYVAAYPNLPEWISPVSIYSAWCAISAIGLCGYLLVRSGLTLPGLFVLVVYAVLGFDGLLHYGRAPMSEHTLGMNLTIWVEIATAALALSVVVWLAVIHRVSRVKAKRV